MINYILTALFCLEMMVVLICVPVILTTHLRCIIHNRGYEVSYVDVVTAACIVHIMIQIGQ